MVDSVSMNVGRIEFIDSLRGKDVFCQDTEIPEEFTKFVVLVCCHKKGEAIGEILAALEKLLFREDRDLPLISLPLHPRRSSNIDEIH